MRTHNSYKGNQKTNDSGKDMNVFQEVWCTVRKHKIRFAIYLGFLDAVGFILYPVVWWEFVSIVAPLNFLLVFFASINLYPVDQRKERQKLENSQNESKTIENT